MTIDNDGVGIGITNPTKKLEIVATNQGGGENNTLRFVDTDVTSQANQQTGRIEFFTSDTTQSGVHAYILGATNNGLGNGDLRFGTGLAGSAEERLRITSDGNIGIGTSVPANAADSNNTAILNVGIVTANFYYGDGSNLTGIDAGQVGALTDIVNDTTPQLGGELDVNNNSITGTGNVNLSGIITAIDFNSTSDARLKTNVQVISEPLDKIVRINGVSFNWIENNKPSIGVIADNIQEVLPELVTDTNPKTVNYNGLIGLLIEVVKEQQTQIDSLNERLSRLE